MGLFSPISSVLTSPVDCLALRILSPLLPTILVNPLPLEILSPSITLHLFPSTHPHLPTVRGRVLYRAALWTVPVAWSSVPLVGNVKLQITGERIVRAGSVVTSKRSEDDCGDEKLVVRWKTYVRDGGESAAASTSEHSPSGSRHLAASKNGTNKGLSSLLGGEAPIFKLGKEEQFTGLFIFSFDEEGRISSHTIEHADEANWWDRTAKFVTLTDWLLGKARRSVDPSPEPGLAIQVCDEFFLDSYGGTMKAGLNGSRHRRPRTAEGRA
jgi:Mitochondrial protein up-regulated during meiosis